MIQDIYQSTVQWKNGAEVSWLKRAQIVCFTSFTVQICTASDGSAWRDSFIKHDGRRSTEISQDPVDVV